MHKQRVVKKHTKIYLNHFKYTIADFIPCEICGKQAIDIHHIKSRGIGGSKDKDTIENLMAVCRDCHILYGDKKQYLEFLINTHNKKINEWNS
jgi:5-methylcytosine-specific restriction endonuclease McrA